MIKYNTIKNEKWEIALPQIENNSINTIVTSPPYNKNGLQGVTNVSKSKHIWNKLNIDYESFNDNIPEEEYQQNQIDLLNEMLRVIKPDGSIFYNHKLRRHNNSIVSPMEWILKSDCKIYQVIIWDRKNSPNQRNDHLLPTTEIIYWLTKDKPKVFKKNLPKDYRSEIWHISTTPSEHPAPFPLLLPELCIKLSTEEGDVVLDPYMGSGTTALAAKQLNRKYLGFEISKIYTDKANKLLNQIEVNEEEW